MANKLELTWFGKDEPMHIEPRLLIENTELSNADTDPNTENILIHGDNLLALKALEPMLMPTHYETPSFYDDTLKAHMISVQYRNYRKL